MPLTTPDLLPRRGRTLYPWDVDARPWVGWTRNPDGTWTAPPEPEPEDEA